MSWVYSTCLSLFLLGLAPSVLWQMLLRGKYRRGIGERFGGVAPWKGAARPLWLHAVSVGEVMAAAPLARRLVARYPDVPLLASTTTETGRAVAEQRIPAARFVFFPLDFGWSVRRALTRLRPRLVLLTETELWPNFLAVCAAEGIPTVVINGRTITPSQSNNAYIFPGVGLGVMLSRARRVTSAMFLEAARTLASLVTEATLAEGRLFSPLREIRDVSAAIAVAVMEVAFRDQLATRPRPADLPAFVRANMYDAHYPEYR